MKVRASLFCVLLSLLTVRPTGSMPETEGSVEGVITDILDARISDGTLIFGAGTTEYTAQTRADGTYSIKLKPGTYQVTISSRNFCTVRRAAFVLQNHFTLRLNFQMWVCPTDTQFIQFTELAEVSNTHLKPIIQFAQEDMRGELRIFRGPYTDNDGTGHPRKYPAVFTFNLLTVQADVLLYSSSRHLLTATGNASWENGSVTGTGQSVEIELVGFTPRLTAGQN